MQIEQAADLLKSSQYIIALTGAGISTPSGIPDFRSGKNGLWKKYNPLKVASLSAFRTRPEDFFSWFQPLARLIYYAEPNPAHYSLASLEKLGMMKSVITQNIDGLHQKAGSRSVLEVHGTLFTLTCGRCYLQHDAEDFECSYLVTGNIPTCSQCGGILKPDVILFQEQLPRSVWLAAEEEIAKSDLMIVVGSSLEVTPVAQLPYKVLAQRGKLLIINEQKTYLNDRATLVINDDAAKVLPAILEKLTDV
jgi:NAD-dependent deacetylase